MRAWPSGRCRNHYLHDALSSLAWRIRCCLSVARRRQGCCCRGSGLAFRSCRALSLSLLFCAEALCGLKSYSPDCCQFTLGELDNFSADAAWLRQLHSYGLLRGSFRPNSQVATLRAYLRQRERLVEYAAACPCCNHAFATGRAIALARSCAATPRHIQRRARTNFSDTDLLNTDANTFSIKPESCAS